MPLALPALPASLRARLLLAVGLVAALVLAVVVVTLVDATWLRPFIQQHVQQRSGRQIDFERLRLGLDAHGQPTVRVEKLAVQNAPWAGTQPLVRAGEFNFTVSWESLWAERIVLTHLALVDAELDLRRQADGLRNWRLTRPDDRGPGRVRVLALDAQRTRAHIEHRGIGLELDLQSQPLAGPAASVAAGEPPLTRSVSIRGSSRGVAFQGQVEVGDEVTLFDTGRPFALRGRVASARSSLQADGRAQDLLGDAGLDLQLQVASSRADELPAALGYASAPLRLPAQLQGRLQKTGNQWRLAPLQLRVGDSDAAGSLAFQERSSEAARPSLRASLRSRQVDWAALRGASRRPEGSGNSAAGPSAPRWQSADAELDWQVQSLSGVLPAPIGPLRAKASLQQGQWLVEPLVAGVYGGQATGRLALDARHSPGTVTLALDLRDLQLERLMQGTKANGDLTGRLNLRVALRSQGESFAALGAGADGTLQASLTGASLAPALEAKLALDGGRWLRSALGGDGGRVAVQCGAATLDVAAGQGRVRQLSLQTARLSLTGSGRVALAPRRVDLLLTPHRKRTSLLALDRALHVTGTPGAFSSTLVDKPPGPPPQAGCAAAAAGAASSASTQLGMDPASPRR